MDGESLALLDQVEHAIFVIEPDGAGRPVYAGFNRFASDVLGRRQSEILGLTARELYPGRLGEIAYQNHQETLTTGQPRSYEIQLPIQGNERHIRTSLRPIGTPTARQCA